MTGSPEVPRSLGGLAKTLDESRGLAILVLSMDGVIIHASVPAGEQRKQASESLIGESLAECFRIQPFDQAPTRDLLRKLSDGASLTLSPVGDPGRAHAWGLQRSALLTVLVREPQGESPGEHVESDSESSSPDSLETLHRICERACAAHRFEQWTDREAEVVGLIAHGRTTKQIARELGISRRTVDRHRENVVQKAGIETPAQLGHLYAFVELLSLIRGSGSAPG